MGLPVRTAEKRPGVVEKGSTDRQSRLAVPDGSCLGSENWILSGTGRNVGPVPSQDLGASPGPVPAWYRPSSSIGAAVRRRASYGRETGLMFCSWTIWLEGLLILFCGLSWQAPLEDPGTPASSKQRDSTRIHVPNTHLGLKQE